MGKDTSPKNPAGTPDSKPDQEPEEPDTQE